MAGIVEVANKRIPVTAEVWESLSNLKRAGETYDHLLGELIALKQERDFLDHIEEVEMTGQFISMDDAAKELGLKKVD